MLLLFNVLTSCTGDKYVCAAVQCCRGYGGDVEEAAAEGRVEATLHHCATQQDCWQGHPYGCREESRKLGQYLANVSVINSSQIYVFHLLVGWSVAM